MQLSVYKEHYKETIRLGVPIMLGQLGIIVVGFADNIMVGHHSTAELAAASFVGSFFNLVIIAVSYTPAAGRIRVTARREGSLREFVRIAVADEVPNTWTETINGQPRESNKVVTKTPDMTPSIHLE